MVYHGEPTFAARPQEAPWNLRPLPRIPISARRHRAGAGARFAFAILAVLALYAVDLVCVLAAPEAADGLMRAFAVPFDLMVCAPAAFYLIVLRRFGLRRRSRCRSSPSAAQRRRPSRRSAALRCTFP